MQISDWQRSSYCATGESCIHIAHAAADRAVRLTESGDPAGVILSATRRGFAGLLRAIKEDHVP
ncbi:DUF397 domain-containing protein [Streptomyces sp. HNM0663]|uniref:DUF397 domain-containing protein n=1 Tax=Streptomyces chengmaiensis TaxID=3040919 RepID=A0ABT6HWG8_9ACTN|nr:DUF397 domain-containing protein [Streptomyces chengmaiensis]MDH2392740.1 DUF397 domain-containing protein [Streptomyces chengmaiensis]